MGAPGTIWKALTTIIQMEGRVDQQAKAIEKQQAKIENLTGRAIRLEAQMDMLLLQAGTRSSAQKKLT